jgi:hypothetical protein
MTAKPSEFHSFPHVFCTSCTLVTRSYPAWSSPVDFALIPKVGNTDDFPCQPFIKPTIRQYKFGQFQAETVFVGNFVVRPHLLLSRKQILNLDGHFRHLTLLYIIGNPVDILVGWVPLA